MPNFTLPRPARITRDAQGLRSTGGHRELRRRPGVHRGAEQRPDHCRRCAGSGQAGRRQRPAAHREGPRRRRQAGPRAVASSVSAGLKVTAVEKQSHAAEQAANRSVERKAIVTPKAAPKAPKAPKATPKRYANNLDGWIRESLDIMKDKGIPGSYEGLHRNIMRESSGDPNAVNDWDINAINGVPSKGLLQVIQPTFDTYHVAGTPRSSPTRSPTSPRPPTTRPTATARSTTSTRPTEPEGRDRQDGRNRLIRVPQCGPRHGNGSGPARISRVGPLPLPFAVRRSCQASAQCRTSVPAPDADARRRASVAVAPRQAAAEEHVENLAGEAKSLLAP